MRSPAERIDFVHEFLSRVFAEDLHAKDLHAKDLHAKDLHAKRVQSLANGALGVMTSAALAVSLIGQARAILPKSGIQVGDPSRGSKSGIQVGDQAG
jgi:hypothetical protein